MCEWTCLEAWIKPDHLSRIQHPSGVQCTVLTKQMMRAADGMRPESSTHASTETQAALEAATAAAETAARDCAAAHAEAADLGLRCAAYEHKATQLGDELKEQTAALQVGTTGSKPPEKPDFDVLAL